MNTPESRKWISIDSPVRSGNNAWFLVITFITFVILILSSYSAAQPWSILHDLSAPQHLEAIIFISIFHWVAVCFFFVLLAPVIIVIYFLSDTYIYFRGSYWKMQQDWQSKAMLTFIQYMLHLFLPLILVSQLKEYWNSWRSGSLNPYPRVIYNYLLGFSPPPIILLNAWR